MGLHVWLCVYSPVDLKSVVLDDAIKVVNRLQVEGYQVVLLDDVRSREGRAVHRVVVVYCCSHSKGNISIVIVLFLLRIDKDGLCIP